MNSLDERLKEVLAERGISDSKFRSHSVRNVGQLIELADSLDLIPLLLYSEPDGEPVDLGRKSILYGDVPEDYALRAFALYGTVEQLCSLARVDKTSYYRYLRRPESLPIRWLEIVAASLKLAPCYLVEILDGNPVMVDAFQKTVERLEQQLISGRNPKRIRRALEYAERLAELGLPEEQEYFPQMNDLIGALRLRLDVLNSHRKL